MKSRIETIITYKYDRESELLGVDGRYHYFYRIVNNINGKYYFGIHSTKNLNDGYSGSGTILRLSYKKYGRDNFSMYLERFFESRDELIKYEEQIVDNDLVQDDLCYNIIQGGLANPHQFNWDPNKPHHSLGRIHINNGEHNKVVNPGELDEYLANGYVLGELQHTTIGKVVVNKEGLPDRFIYPEEIPTYLKDGWVCGGRSRNKGQKSFAKGQMWIMKDDIRKRINPDELQSYINNGWQKGTNQRCTSGYIMITDGQTTKNIPPDQLQSYLDTGWRRGSIYHPNKGKIWVKRGCESYIINPMKLQQYLDDGYELGRYIDTSNKRVNDYSTGKLRQNSNKNIN